MKEWIQGFWRGLADEIFLKSKYGKELGADTFLRWIVSVSVFAICYWLIYNYDAMSVKYDQWMHSTFGQELSDVPSNSKVSWHRLTGGVLCGVGAIAATFDFTVNLYRRIKARIAASKAKAAQEDKSG
jgi:hypothetical protein